MRAPSSVYSWDNLLEYIEEGLVIPVIGPEVLVARFDGERTEALSSYIARRLGRKAGFLQGDANPEPSLDAVIAGIREAGGPKAGNSELRRILLEPMPIPEPLANLARIGGLRLFVNMTVSPLLEEALRSERRCEPRRVVYTFNRPGDLPDDRSDSSANPTVFYLMGYPSLADPYARTEEETLEFIHSLQTSEKRPKRLFDQFRNRHLLLLGCTYGDWLTRFVLRTVRNGPLSRSDEDSQLLADSQTPRDVQFCSFIERYCTGVEVHPSSSAAEFIAELAARWEARQRGSSEATRGSRAARESDEDGPAPEPMKAGEVFISYAHEDIEAARGLRKCLEERNLDVWMDERRLRAGDKWDREIERNIGCCSLFIPVVSASTETRKESYFHLEWKLARQRLMRLSESRKFIFPVVIDDTPFHAADVPSEFQRHHATLCPAGVPPADFVDELTRAHREAQKASARR